VAGKKGQENHQSEKFETKWVLVVHADLGGVTLPFSYYKRLFFSRRYPLHFILDPDKNENPFGKESNGECGFFATVNFVRRPALKYPSGNRGLTSCVKSAI